MVVKILKWIGIVLLSCILLIIISLYVTGNDYILKGIRVTYLTGHSTAFIEDYTYFDNRVIHKGSSQPWNKSSIYNTLESTAKLDSIHKQFGTTAYLIIKDDSLVFEKYYQGTSDSTKSNSFSMAKSITALLLGKALELNYIKSLDDKVIQYLPELKGKYANEVTVRDLVTMRSGLAWDESYYSPFSITTKAYFDDELSKAILELPISSQPNQEFFYQSGTTQLLAMVLSKALPMSLSEFLTTYFWQPMGAEQDALWQYNQADGIEKAYCCIASNAKDFARFGKLYLQDGVWNNKQLISKEYVKQSIEPAANNSQEYGFGWWLGTYNGKKTFTMNGHLGQYVITIPEDKLIIVRLGQQTDKKGMINPNSAYNQYIEQAYKMLDQE